jgi:ADP-heptose:LPS heptosyltransferase
VKILIISSNLIGDTILSTGVVNYFHKIYPHAKFTFLVGPTAGQIYINFPTKEKIILVKKQKFNLHWLIMYLKVFKIKWDIVIDFRSSFISYLLNKKKKYIFKKNKNLNHLDQLKDFFSINKLCLSVFTNKNEEAEANQKISHEYKYIVLFPGGNWKPKIWPIEYFNKLIHFLNDNFTNLKFIIVGSLKEKRIYFEDIKKNLPDKIFIDLMGKSLTSTFAYMTKCNLFIGNDSGLMHLSVAANLKTIALFGPTNDKIYGHFNANSFVIRTKESYKDFEKNTIDITKSYMNSIEPEEVLNFIMKKNLL